MKRWRYENRTFVIGSRNIYQGISNGGVEITIFLMWKGE